ncbi:MULTISPECIES: hypothetical protein [unclassified Nostoc]|uniref:hypothetical protein n=1 Tax=unclassified Nostoc TaxID=2593658 RepID=UPI001CB8F1AC|nr:hypothetical protein [Nostoc sp. 'Peltigera membranacea cyanobiont' 213]
MTQIEILYNVKAKAATDCAKHGNVKAEAATGKAEAATGKTEVATGKAEAATGKAEVATGKAEVATGKAEAATGKTKQKNVNPEGVVLHKSYLFIAKIQTNGKTGGYLSKWLIAD